MSYIAENTPWIRPADTGRSTNCRINEVGISVHQRERGFHNYSLPYSWDVRLGHKQRDQALAELNDDIDQGRVSKILDEVGYAPRDRVPEAISRLAAYYVSKRSLSSSDLRRFLARKLPAELIPWSFVPIAELPLTSNGKLDHRALPDLVERAQPRERAYVEPASDRERQLVRLWERVLGAERVGVEDDFFELGGDSIHVMQIVSLAAERGLWFMPRDVFAHPTVAELAAAVRSEPVANEPIPPAAMVTESELQAVLDEFGEA